MGPEVLIVGDASRRAGLRDRIEQLGYSATMSTGLVLGQRVAQRQLPAAVVVCTEDVDPRALLSELRSTRPGSGVPVTLHGPLGGKIGDLADVLDLGADHFLEEPAEDEQLLAALEQLVGPGVPRPRQTPSADEDEDSGRTAAPGSSESAAEGGDSDREEASADPSESAAKGGASAEGDAVLGQLHRTLDILEERLREREAADADNDELDLAELGFTELPDTDEGLSGSGSGRGPASSLELSISNPESKVKTRSPYVRDPTERLRDPPGADASESSPPESSPSRSAADRPRRRTPLPIEDRGAIDRVEVPRLLWTLHQAHFTGLLSLEYGRVGKRLWWREGDIMVVRSNVGHDRLIDGLLRRGLLTREQYEAARRLVAKEPRRTGELLVEAGFVKPAELPRVLRNHLIRIIDSCFPWTDGRWSLEPDETCEDTVLADTPVSLIVAEGIRHRMESAQLTALLGGLDQHPRFRQEAAVVGGAAALAERLMMSPSEESWLPRLDGSQSLRTLCAHPATDELELLGLTYMLHVLEYLELSAAGAVVAGADPVTIDTARIRDRLELARESDYFAVLGVPRDAERLDVRRAHAELRQTFADEHLDAEARQQLADQLGELRDLLDEARGVLEDDTLRSAYLAHLEEA